MTHPLTDPLLGGAARRLYAGRYVGAFGRHASKSTGIFGYETVITAYVPRVKAF
jgi:hypothetical protein